MAEVSANCGEQAADIGRNALSHVKKITETTGLPKCSRFLEVPYRSRLTKSKALEDRPSKIEIIKAQCDFR